MLFVPIGRVRFASCCGTQEESHSGGTLSYVSFIPKQLLRLSEVLVTLHYLWSWSVLIDCYSEITLFSWDTVENATCHKFVFSLY